MGRIVRRRQTLSGLLTVGCLLLLLCLLTARASAADIVASGTCGGEGDGSNLTWTLDNEGTLTISGKGKMADYASGSKQPWYSDRSSLKTLVIESGVTSIGESAFYGCSGFTGSLTLPDSVTSIGNYAFYNCDGFTGSLVIPDSVISIGSAAFRDCSGFAGSLVIPDSVTSIGGDAFAYCESFRGDLLIPDSVTTIANGTFMGCRFGGSLVIPDSVISIDQHAFYECGITGDLIIPNSVTSIGMYAFYGCTGFTGSLMITDSVESIGNFAFYGCTHFDGSLTIGNSVTSIGDYAFQNCSGFTGSLTIGDSVTRIDYKTFQNCSGFTGDLVIPDSVTNIDDYAFAGCSGFTGSLVIPASVTRIGAGAFSGCSGFAGDLVIPASVTRIGAGAFSGCSGFAGDLVIPDSVTSIGANVFEGCSGLSGKIYFCGDAPAVYASSSGDRSFDTGSVLYYIPGTSGWADSSYYNAAAGTWNGYTLKTWDGPRKILTTVAEQTPAGQYGILVVDSTGLSIQGAEVTVNGVSVITGETGLALFDALTAGPPHITVTCDGYRDWSNTDSDYMQSANGYDIVILHPDMLVNMHLAFAYYKTTTEGVITRPAIDLLSQTKRLSLSSTEGTFTLSCAAVDAEQAVGYALYQGDRMIRYVAASSSDETTGGGLGLFSDLSIQSFSAGGDVFIRAYGANGYTVNTRINLSFVDDARKEYKNSIKLGGNKLTFTTNQDVPFVGGSTLTFDIPDLPFDIVVSEDTVHFGINFNLKTDDEKSFADKRKEITEVMKQLKALKGVNISKNLRKQLDSFMEKNDMNVPAAGKVKASFIGYGEGKLDEDGMAAVNTELYILVQASATIQGPTYVVVVVPVSFSVKVGVDGKLAASVSYDMRTSTLNGDVKFTLTPKLEAFGGVGVGKLVGAGAYGSAKLPIEVQLIGTSQTPGVNAIDLTGSLGLKAYVSIFEYKKDFAYKTWHIYTRTAHTAYALRSESWLAGLYDEEAYAAADLSYLAGESGWLGSGIALASLEADTTGTSQLSPLLTGTYRNMQPVLGEANGMPVLVWVQANTARGAYDYPQLVYSCFTGGSWTDPQPVNADNLTADAAPALATAPDGTLYLAYQSSAQPMQEGDDLAAYTANQTIVTARFDGVNGIFTDFATVSGSGVFSRSPVITAAGGTPVVAWVSNSDSGDYFSCRTPPAASAMPSRWTACGRAASWQIIAAPSPTWRRGC